MILMAGEVGCKQEVYRCKGLYTTTSWVLEKMEIELCKNVTQLRIYLKLNGHDDIIHIYRCVASL